MNMKLEATVKGLDKKVAAVVASEGTKSGKMKDLFRLGLDVKQIAELMNVRYNFVYNVVSNMVIVEGIEVEQKSSTSKKDIVFEMLNQGKTVKEIAIELKTNMQYIYKMNKEWKEQVAKEVQAEVLAREITAEVKEEVK